MKWFLIFYVVPDGVITIPDIASKELCEAHARQLQELFNDRQTKHFCIELSK